MPPAQHVPPDGPGDCSQDDIGRVDSLADGVLTSGGNRTSRAAKLVRDIQALARASVPTNYDCEASASRLARSD
jgi:hypothetical protein